MNTTSVSIATVVLGLAGSALAQQAGDILYTDELTGNVRWIANQGGGPTSTVLTVTEAGTRLAGITYANGHYYVADGPNIGDPVNARIIKVTDLFGAASYANLAAGNPIQNPIGLKWDAGRGQLITVNNPGNAVPLNPRFEGILGVGLGGAVTQIYDELPSNTPRPFYFDGADLEQDFHSTDWFLTSHNGGEFGGAGNDASSQIYRLAIDGGLNGTVSQVIDLGNTALTGLADSLNYVLGITLIPGTGDLVVTDQERGGIYRIKLDGSGDFQSISQIASGLDGPGRIEWNKYTQKLVFGEGDGMKISQMNLDGTGYEVLDSGIQVRGIHIVPTPASLALLGLGAVAVLRRRR